MGCSACQLGGEVRLPFAISSYLTQRFVFMVKAAFKKFPGIPPGKSIDQSARAVFR
jgi:hypothetical protein